MSVIKGAFRRNIFPVLIANGAAISAAIDVDDYRPSRIQMPAAWTTAGLSFQTSVDGTTYADLYDGFGNEYVIAAAASREIILPFVDFIGVRHLKVRSGTTGTPVNQGADRNLILGAAS